MEVITCDVAQSDAAAGRAPSQNTHPRTLSALLFALLVSFSSAAKPVACKWAQHLNGQVDASSK